jgi:hypothetical protein
MSQEDKFTAEMDDFNKKCEAIEWVVVKAANTAIKHTVNGPISSIRTLTRLKAVVRYWKKRVTARAPELLEENRRLREAIKKSINNYYGNYGGHIDILKQALEGTE